MAERRGFEPPDRFYPINRLAGGCLQPLGHLSTRCLAEGVGFEPTELSLSGFQDRRLKPLGHPSARPPSDELLRPWVFDPAPQGDPDARPALSPHTRRASESTLSGLPLTT